MKGATVKIEIELGLDDEVGNVYEGGEDRPVTLLEMIVAAAAAQVVNKIDTATLVEIRDRGRNITDEEIRARVGPLVEREMQTPVSPVFGGPAVPLAEHIAKVVKAELTTSTSRGHSVLATMIHAEVQKVLASELRVALNEAKLELMAAVREKGAEVLAETIGRMAVR